MHYRPKYCWKPSGFCLGQRRLQDVETKTNLASMICWLALLPCRQPFAFVYMLCMYVCITLEGDKTKVWSRDAGVRATLHAPLSARWVDKLHVLGSHTPWLDREGRDEAAVPVGPDASDKTSLAKARRLNLRLPQLMAAGLGLKSAYTLLHTFSQGCANHLQCTNFEDGQWGQDLDDELHKGLELLLGTATGAAHRELAGFSAQDGGLALPPSRATLRRPSLAAGLSTSSMLPNYLMWALSRASAPSAPPSARSWTERSKSYDRPVATTACHCIGWASSMTVLPSFKVSGQSK